MKIRLKEKQTRGLFAFRAKHGSNKICGTSLVQLTTRTSYFSIHLPTSFSSIHNYQLHHHGRSLPPGGGDDGQRPPGIKTRRSWVLSPLRRWPPIGRPPHLPPPQIWRPHPHHTPPPLAPIGNYHLYEHFLFYPSFSNSTHLLRQEINQIHVPQPQDPFPGFRYSPGWSHRKRRCKVFGDHIDSERESWPGFIFGEILGGLERKGLGGKWVGVGLAFGGRRGINFGVVGGANASGGGGRDIEEGTGDVGEYWQELAGCFSGFECSHGL